MNSIESIRKQNTITTLEIAEMMEVRHQKVLEKLEGRKDGTQKGIVQVLTEHQMVFSDYFILSSYKDSSGKENKCYNVTKLGCDFLANKFTGEKGIIFTALYVKKFDEMEKSVQKKLPTTYREAVAQLLDSLNREEELQAQLDTSKEWYSIKRVASLNGVSWKTFDWRRLKDIGLSIGYEVKKIFDANYGEVNTYHKNVWEVAYPEYEV